MKLSEVSSRLSANALNTEAVLLPAKKTGFFSERRKIEVLTGNIHMVTE